MSRSQVPIPGCSLPMACPLDEFAAMLAHRIETKCIEPALAEFVHLVRFPTAYEGNGGGQVHLGALVLIAIVFGVAILGAVLLCKRPRGKDGAKLSDEEDEADRRML